MSGLRCGFTTGTCAAAAAKAAAAILVGGEAPAQVALRLPAGEAATLPVEYARGDTRRAEAGVRKDAGDDPDVTDGVLVVATLAPHAGDGILFRAGAGVGTVTKAGLQLPPGEAAINPAPRELIAQAIREVTPLALTVTVAVPGGEALAAQTFNPRLGVVGGLSILGTSGRVRPYSCQAVKDTVACALDVAHAAGVRAPVLVPGNIGARAAEGHFRLAGEQLIEVSNEWGFALDEVARRDFEAVLLLGHPGKLAKLARGVRDTHSSRSAPAAPYVAALLRELSGEAPASETVEGLFAALEQTRRERAGNELAARIRETVAPTYGLDAAVILIDMAGNILGEDGELAPWTRS